MFVSLNWMKITFPFALLLLTNEFSVTICLEDSLNGLTIFASCFLIFLKGWQPGIQEGAADWDEDWDKFDDEGI